MATANRSSSTIRSMMCEDNNGGGDEMILMEEEGAKKEATSTTTTKTKKSRTVVVDETHHHRHNNNMPDDNDNDNDDPIIGLDVCGKIYYCHKSTLVTASPYFASRFRGDFNASVSYVDERTRRSIFFVERLPTTFPYIFEYMISGGTLHFPFFYGGGGENGNQQNSNNKHLIRNLRQEAEFFGLEGMIELLKVTKRIDPISNGNRGVLYWLGTQKGTSDVYTNPFTSGMIHVGGWMEDETNNVNGRWIYDDARISRTNFVQYQGRLNVEHNGERYVLEQNSLVMWCCHCGGRLPVVLDLKSIRLRPTHYSLRVCHCYGMQGDWNFEGSNDMMNWDILHAARNDQHLNLEVPGGSQTKIQSKMNKVMPKNGTQQELSDVLLKLLEQDFRHTWELLPQNNDPQQQQQQGQQHGSGQFYRYFRIIGAGIEGEDLGCLHGEGIELYGDVYEE